MDMPDQLVGYQTLEDWMGVELLTLADVWPENPRAAVVGLNPAPESVRVGHYYQGRVGLRQMQRLIDAGLFAPTSSPHYEEAALAAGVGFTDIVKRPSTGERDLHAEEIRHGSAVLETKLCERQINLIVCVFRHPVEILLGSEGTPGFQPRTTSWGARVFRMPGPFDKRERVQHVMAELRDTVVG